MIINCAGSAYGYYWYRYQLAETRWYYLPFIPDSPLSSTLFSIVLVTILLGVRVRLLELFAYLWVIKYGVWAVLINLDAGYTYGTFNWENWLLTLSHLGMAVEGFLFLRHLNFSKRHVGVMALWLGINDYMDYVAGLHPFLFDPGQIGLARFSAIILSALLVVLSYYHVIKKNAYS